MGTSEMLRLIQQHLQAQNIVKKDAVKIHAGKFTWRELKKRGFNAPALFITCLGWKEASDEDKATLGGVQQVFNARFAIGIVTKHAKGIEARNREARALAEHVTAQLISQDWQQANVLEATQLRAEGLFVAAAEEENHSLWLVTWQQSFGTTTAELISSCEHWLRGEGTHTDSEGNVLAVSEFDISDEHKGDCQ